MISIYEIIRQMFSENTIIFQGFLMIVGTFIFTLIITRNTRKMLILALPISVGIFFMGVQPSYWFMAVCGIAYTLGIWNNEFNEKELEFNNL